MSFKQEAKRERYCDEPEREKKKSLNYKNRTFKILN